MGPLVVWVQATNSVKHWRRTGNPTHTAPYDVTPGAVSWTSKYVSMSAQGRCELLNSMALPDADFDGAIAQPFDPCVSTSSRRALV